MLLLPSLLLEGLSLPATLFLNIAQKIHDQAWEELYGEESIKRDLLRLQLYLERGELSEEEYLKAEKVLLDRLERAQATQGG